MPRSYVPAWPPVPTALHQHQPASYRCVALAIRYRGGQSRRSVAQAPDDEAEGAQTRRVTTSIASLLIHLRSMPAGLGTPGGSNAVMAHRDPMRSPTFSSGTELSGSRSAPNGALRPGGLWQCELYERLHNQEDPEGDDDHASGDSQGPGEWWTPSSGTVSCDQDPTHHEDDCQCGGNRSSRYAGDR